METNVAQQRFARLTGWILAGLFAAIFCTAAQAQSSSGTPDGPVAHGTIATAAPVTYDNRFEIFGGLNYMGFKAGPYLTQNMNMGGGEVMGTYWLRKGLGRYIKPNVLGLAADYRFDAGTTPVQPNPVGLNRTLVYQNILMGGVQVRGPRNEFVALGGACARRRLLGQLQPRHLTDPAHARRTLQRRQRLHGRDRRQRGHQPEQAVRDTALA